MSIKAQASYWVFEDIVEFLSKGPTFDIYRIACANDSFCGNKLVHINFPN